MLKLYFSLQGYKASLGNARKHNLIYFLLLAYLQNKQIYMGKYVFPCYYLLHMISLN